MSWAGDESEELRGRVEEVEDLGDEEQQHCLAEVAEDGNHRKHQRVEEVEDLGDEEQQHCLAEVAEDGNHRKHQRVEEVEDLGDEEQQHCLAEVAEDGNHRKHHASKVAVGVPNKHSGGVHVPMGRGRGVEEKGKERSVVNDQHHPPLTTPHQLCSSPLSPHSSPVVL